MVDLHREFGIPPPPQDVRAAYTFADYVAYVDIPELVPMREMPGKHRFIGPVLWSPACDLPDWWGALEAETLPIIYVTLGSSGADSILPRVIAALEQLPVIGIVASAGNPWDGKLPPNIHLVKFIPGEMVAQRAALVVCNGGSPTAYQALNAGKPVLGICTNLDQQLNMSTLCAAGVGCMITASSAEIELIRETVTHMLAEPALAVSAGRIRESISRYDVASQFEGLLCDILY